MSNSNPQRHKSNPSLPKKHHTLLTPTKDWLHLPLIKGATMPREFIKEPLRKWWMIVSTTWSAEKVYQKKINYYGLFRKTTITNQVSKIAILHCFPTPKATNTRNKSTKEPGNNTHSQPSHTHTQPMPHNRRYTASDKQMIPILHITRQRPHTVPVEFVITLRLVLLEHRI